MAEEPLRVEVLTSWQTTLMHDLPYAVAVSIIRAKQGDLTLPVERTVGDRRLVREAIAVLYGQLLSRGEHVLVYDHDGADWALPAHAVLAVRVVDPMERPDDPRRAPVGFQLGMP